MINTRAPLLLAFAAVLLAACATTPPESTSSAAAAAAAGADAEHLGMAKHYMRPPHRLYGILLEQGGLDADPDVSAMVEYQQQRVQERAALLKSRKAAPVWEQLGPDNNLGRVIDIAFHPQNSSIIYASSPGGGVYKSTNAGDSWTKLTALPYQPVNSIAIDPRNPNVVYFATGHFSGSGSDLLSLGVYKTTDAGATMTLLRGTVPTTTNTDWLRVTRVVVHPVTPNLVFAGTSTGFFISSDGGAAWTKVSSASTYDIAIDPHDPTRMLRGRYNGGVSISTNTGQTWGETQIVPPSMTTNIHTRVKYAKGSPRLVYASVNQNDGEIWKSTDGGSTWTKLSNPRHLSTQGFHTNQLWISPIDTNHIISGGVDLFKSLDGGLTFTKISNWQANSSQTSAGLTPSTPHADHNAVASPPDYSASKQHFYVGTDGGLFSTANARTVTETIGWTKSGGPFSITQFVGSAGRRSAAGIDILVGGTQDNGTLLNIGYAGWTNIAGGDGGYAQVDPAGDMVFGEYQNGAVFRYSIPGGLRQICNGILEAEPSSCAGSFEIKLNFYAPLELDPGGRLYLGANSLWRTTNPRTTATWTVVKEPVAGTTTATTSSNYINAMAIYQANPAIAIMGHNDGQLFRSVNLTAGAPTWTALPRAGLPTGRAVGAVYIDPQDSNRLYVGFTGYFANNLWRSDNGGTTWTNISAGLPPGSIYVITRHPQAKERVFVGTIWNSYGSPDGGLTWPIEYDGPAATQVRRMFWLGNDVLGVATFGNGMFRATVSPAAAVPPADSVVEYYHPVLDNYFITADPVEQAAVDSGAAGAEWRRTGGFFAAGGPSKVCRFYGSISPGPNSHFYTIDPVECEDLKSLQATTPATQKRWNFESLDFASTIAVNRQCPAGTVPVYRAYNNGFARGVDSNHRITTSLSAIQQVLARGWKDEGVVMCAPS